MNKKWYLSKMVWANVIAIVATVIGGEYLDAEMQVAILAVINLILRAVTKENLTW